MKLPPILIPNAAGIFAIIFSIKCHTPSGSAPQIQFLQYFGRLVDII